MNHIFISLVVSLCVVAAGISGVEWLALYIIHHVRHIIITAIGDGGSKIGYLQRRRVDLSLSDRDTDYGESVPRAAVSIVVEFSIWYQSSFLSWEVDTEFISESHADHIVAPCVHGVLHTSIF